MKKKRLKKGTAVLLSLAMTLGLMPTVTKPLEVQAEINTLPDVTQFATQDELTHAFDLDNSGNEKVQKVIFGQNGSGQPQEWLIAGTEKNSGNNIVLFAATPMLTGIKFDSKIDVEKPYDSTWNCSYNLNPLNVNPNHYGASELRKSLGDLLENMNYFSRDEATLIQDTAITTLDSKSNTKYTTKDKLYIANRNSNTDILSDNYITVGSNDELKIYYSNWVSGYTWLRTATTSDTTGYSNSVSSALKLPEAHKIPRKLVNDSTISVAPAFDLSLAYVPFASAAEAATKDGKLAVGDAFTLRQYSGYLFATLTHDKTMVEISGDEDELKEAYLVVQNSAGAWAKKVNGDTVISAKDIDASLTTFEGCKVWLERTNTRRITSAGLATEGTGNGVSITAGSNMTKTSESGNDKQIVSASMTNIVYTANEGYYFPENYNSNQELNQNGITIKRDSPNQITVSGTPTADTYIDLKDPTAKTTETTPVIGIDYSNDKLTGFVAGASYTINANAVSPTNEELPVEPYIGTSISIVKKATDSAIGSDSVAQSLVVPARPTAPSVTGEAETISGVKDGKITGTTEAMEYKLSSAQNWTKCMAGETTGLEPGRYQVRTKATTASFSSAATEISIAAGTVAYEALQLLIQTVNTHITDGTYGEKNYTTASITNLRTALKAAQSIKENATEADILKAYQDLQRASTVAADGLVEKAYTVAVQADPATGGKLSGGGSFGTEDTATIEATPATGYRFDGWYEGLDTSGKLVSTNVKYVIPTKTGNMTYTAKFTQINSLSLKTIGSGTVYQNDNSVSVDYTEPVAVGTKIVLKAVANEGYEFVYWMDKNNRILSYTADSYTTYVGLETQIQAVFQATGKTEGNKWNYRFLNKNGNVISSSNAVDGNKITAPASNPFLIGYTFKGWKIKGMSDDKLVDFSTFIITSNTVFEAVYEKEVQTTYKVSVTGGKISGTGSTTGNFAFDSLITVVADLAPEGKVFSYWKNDKEEVVSYDKSYSFYVGKPITLTAVFEETAVEAVPTIVGSVAKVDKINRKLSFLFDRMTPDGYTMVQNGCIATDDATLGKNTDDFVLDATNLKYTILSTSQNGTAQSMWTKSDATTTWYVRGFLTYVDKSGVTITIYTDILIGALSE